MTECVVCEAPIDDLETAHAAHERGCPVPVDAEDWACGCDGFAHVRCCPACNPRQRVRDVLLAASVLSLAIVLFLMATAAPTSTSPPPTTIGWAPTGTLHVGDGDSVTIEETP